jgi:hypothetical protein
LTPRVPAALLDEILQLIETAPPEQLAPQFRARTRGKNPYSGAERLAARALLLLLADLAEQGWRLQSARGSIWVTPPPVGAAPGEPVSR